MQKQLTLTELKAKFTKSFETFGKMDPFLIFHVNRNEEKKTETAEGAGKQPKWTKTIVLKYMEETSINVKAFEEDMTTNELMGEGTINVKLLKEKGQIQVAIMGEEQESIGMIYGNYTLKTLAPAPFLIVKNIKCDFYKQAKFLLKTKPFVRVHSTLQSIDFQTKKETDSKAIVWNESQKIKIKDTHKIQFKLLDSDDQNSQIFSIDLPLKDFRTLAGSKKYNVNDKKYDPLAVFSFEYETLNFVNKEDSVRNQEKIMKDEGVLNLVSIHKIRGQFKEGGNDIYMKILIGPNKITTKEISNAKKDFESQVDGKLYAESKENKIIISVFDKDLIQDDVLGAGYILLEGLSSGQKAVDIIDKQKKEIGKLYVDLSTSKVMAKTMTISNIKLKTQKSNDIIGQSDNFLVARVGGWNSRTQTVSGQQVQFKKAIELHYSNQQNLDLQIFDEDITQNQKVLSVCVKLQELEKKKNGFLKVPLGSISSKKKGGDLSFDYNFLIGDKTGKKQSFSESAKKKQDPNRKSQILQKKIIRQKTQKSLKQSSVHESRSFKLPSIYEKRYGDEIYNISSAATLQKSIHAFSMPKAERFRDRPKYNGVEPSYHVESCFKNDRSRGPHIGFGEKKILPDYVMKNMKENPGPDTYGSIERKEHDYKKGKTFGASRVCYDKVLVPDEKKFLKKLLKK